MTHLTALSLLLFTICVAYSSAEVALMYGVVKLGDGMLHLHELKSNKTEVEYTWPNPNSPKHCVISAIYMVNSNSKNKIYMKKGAIGKDSVTLYVKRNTKSDIHVVIEIYGHYVIKIEEEAIEY